MNPRISLRFIAIVIAIQILLALNLSCSGGGSATIEEVSVGELHNILARDTTVNLIDVRTLKEYRAAHVPYVKERLDYEDIVSSIDTLKFPKNEPIYLICRTGRRSAIAATALSKAGYRNPINVLGGTTAWQQSGYQVIKH